MIPYRRTPADGDGRQATVDRSSTPVTIETTITTFAVALTIILTAAAFWLSYEHLHDVAARHGMGGAPARSWAWPATIDTFVAIGELLILRASLAKRVDWWAIGLVVAGSTGSIALNVAGVGTNATPLDYVVAAVPPVAALLAFGALMRQLHAYLARRVLTPVESPSTPVKVTVERAPGPAERAAGHDGAEPFPDAVTGSERRAIEAPVNPASTAVDLCPPVVYPNRVDQLVRALYGTLGVQPTTSQMTSAMTAYGLGASESTARTARARVKARETYLADFPAALAS